MLLADVLEHPPVHRQSPKHLQALFEGFFALGLPREIELPHAADLINGAREMGVESSFYGRVHGFLLDTIFKAC